MTGHALSLGWAYVLLVVIGVFGGLADVWVYKWAKADRAIWLAAACGAHAAGMLLFGLLLRWDTRAFCTVFMLSSVVHVVIVVGADALFFNGRLTLTEWAGMALAAVAVIVLEVGRPDKPHEAGPATPIASVAGEGDRVRP